MPVQTGNFDDLITLLFIVAPANLVRHDEEVDNTPGHVQSVEACHHEEHRAKLRGAVGVALRTNALVYD